MSLADWNSYIDAIRNACEQHVATFPTFRDEDTDLPTFDVSPPATVAEIAKIESALGTSIPSSLRNVFTTYSNAVDIAWQLPDGNEPPEPFDEIFSGQLNFNLHRLPEIQSDYNGWVENCFSDAGNSYDRVWHNKFAFLKVPNGDMVAIDLNEKDHQPVVYLSHDDGEGHGYMLGNDAEDFIDRFLRIGCPGLEDWQWLPFVADSESGIIPACDNAVQWRQWFKLNTQAD